MDVEELRKAYPRFEGDWDHLAALLRGVEHWNEWSYGEFRQSNGGSVVSRGGRGAQLAGLDLSSTPERPLGELWRFDKSRNCWYADLRGARLENANLEGADLKEVRLDNAVLWWANLRHTNLERARLEGTDLEAADLTNSDLSSARMMGATLRHADFSNSDLRVWAGTQLRLDDSRILHARFGPASSDPWSVVRRGYSGPALLFHLLFLVAFLIPYFGRATYWKGVNAAQTALEAAQVMAAPLLKHAMFALEDLEKSPPVQEELEALWLANGLDSDLLPRGREVFAEAGRRQRVRFQEALRARTLRPLMEIGPCLRPVADCGPPQPLVRPLLGLHRGNGPLVLRYLALVLVVYNLFRGGFTWWISRLRDDEERGGYSPRLSQYMWVYRVHTWFLQFVPWAAMAAASFQVAEWLFATEVVLPVV